MLRNMPVVFSDSLFYKAMASDWKTRVATAAFIGAGSLATYFLYKRILKPLLFEKWVQVGFVTDILIYPTKSGKGRPVATAECTSIGMRNGDHQDRLFVITDENGKFITARDVPKLVLMETRVEQFTVTLLAPECEPISFDLNRVVSRGNVVRVSLWDDMQMDAYDCGAEISAWIQKYLQSDKLIRLCYHAPGMFNGRCLDKYPKFRGIFGGRNDPVTFTDLAPYLLMTESSMDDLNTRTPNQEKFSVRNFRPNIVVSGSKPYDEDDWSKIRIGDTVTFTNIKHCTRCVLTTINWATGKKHEKSEPLRTLSSYRLVKIPKWKKLYAFSPLFGINLANDKPGTIKIGDPVYIVYRRLALFGSHS